MTQTTSDSNADTKLPTSESDEKRSGWSMTRIAILVGGGFLGFVLVIFVLAVIFAFIDVEGLARFVEVFRDLFIIVLALSSTLIFIALAVLIAQVARLINLFQQGFSSIVEDLQETTQTAKGTAQFVSTNVTAPIVKAGGFFAGLLAFIREFGGLRRALSPSRSARALTPVDEVAHGGENTGSAG